MALYDELERQAWGGRADEVWASAEGESLLDVELGPGDALYLLAVGSTRPRLDTSMHLTLGPRRPTGYSIVEALATLESVLVPISARSTPA